MSVQLGIGLAGLGTVGGGLVDMLAANREWVKQRTGRDVVVTVIADRNPDKRARVEAAGARFMDDALALTAQPDVDVVVELIGGTTVAGTIMEQALQNGKHAVTANKALLAEKGAPLFSLAAEKGLHLGFEAAVGGGIPIVETIKGPLAGNRIHTILGILNGTANFIMTRMSVDGMEFGEALQLAQDKGYAEADPTLDIEGWDSAHKLVLLIQLCFGSYLPLDKLTVSGVSKVQPIDILIAEEFECHVKLIAMAREVDGKVEAGVFPALVPDTYLLSSVVGSFNAVRLDGNGGPVMLYGYGAGDLPTGSAVLADIMTIAKGHAADNLGFTTGDFPDAQLMNSDDVTARHYFRFTVADRPGVLAALSKACGDHGVSIESAMQKGDPSGDDVPIVFLTHEAPAGAVNRVLAEIDAMDFIREKTVHYRVL